MRFYGNGVVWDAENNKPLVRFAGGVFETTDKHIADKLIALGYKHDGDEPTKYAPIAKAEKPDVPAVPVAKTAKPATPVISEEAPSDLGDMNVNELRELGRSKGLSFKFGTTKADIVAAIAAAK